MSSFAQDLTDQRLDELHERLTSTPSGAATIPGHLPLDGTSRQDLCALIAEVRRRRQEQAHLGQDLGAFLGHRSTAEMREALTSAADSLATTYERAHPRPRQDSAPDQSQDSTTTRKERASSRTPKERG